MTVISVSSVKHAPGATTLALALVTAWSTGTNADGRRAAVLIEADPAGGDLAGRIGLRLDPGLVSMAASARHPGSPIDITPHLQPLPCGGSVVLGPTRPDQAEAAVRGLADRLPGAVRTIGRGVMDCGRWAPGSVAEPAMAASDFSLVVAHPDLVGVEHLRSRMDALARLTGGRLGIILLGDRPYGPAVVRQATHCDLVAVLAVDDDGAASLHGARSAGFARRSRLVRSARSILDAVEAAAGELVTA